MKHVQYPDSHHLKAAQGWLELGNHLEANEELERIRPQFRAHPEVLLVRYKIFAKAERWDACLDIAGAVTKMCPDWIEAWLDQSEALHKLKRTQEAHNLLMGVRDDFQKDHRMPYRLACYCSQLNRFTNAQEHFKRAMELEEKTVQEMALDDPDLKPLWNSMSGTIWKKQ